MNLNPGGNMNPTYVWPVCVAAAVHGALLFGFPKSARPALVRPEVAGPVCDFRLPPPEEELVALLPAEATGPTTSSERDRPLPPDVAPAPEIDRRAVITRPEITTPEVGDWPAVVVRPPPGPVGEGEGRWRDRIELSGSLDRAPRTRLQTAPFYPAEARRDGRSGTVTVEFVVNEAGEVMTPRVTSASDRIFEAAALRAVAKWRFEPGRRDGRIVRFRMVVPIHFSLNE